MSATEPPAQPRKRGRPRKEGGPAQPKPIVLDASGQPRKRGRPRKYPLDQVAKPQPQQQDPNAPKRARGRPKKIQRVTQAQNTDANGTTEASTGVMIPFKKIVGSYTLECPAVEENWPDLIEEMEMTITESQSSDGLVASFNLGILEGTMILSPDAQSLEAFHQKILTEDIGVSSTPSSGTGNAGLQLLFKWRGRGTGDGEVHTGSTGGNEGMIEFQDDKALQFKGVGSFPALGTKCDFTGTKFGHNPSTTPMPWTTFSDDAAERSRLERWK